MKTGVDILPTAEHEALLAAIDRTLEKLFPFRRLHLKGTLAECAAASWRTIADQGWIGMGLPEEAGGVGYELSEAVLAHRRFGRQLMTPSLTATVVAAKIAIETDQASSAGRLVRGEARAAFVMPCGQSGMQEQYVIDGEGAELFVGLGRSGAQLMSVDMGGARDVEALDPTTRLARVKASPQGDPCRVAGLWAQTLLGAELSGIAQAASEMAVEYAKTREQFGKLIGAFQAVAHACADGAMRAEAAVALSNFAAISVRDLRSDADFQAAASLWVAADAAFRNATDNIQLHGGMGFAAESGAHLYLKRALLLRALGRAIPAQAAADPSVLEALI